MQDEVNQEESERNEVDGTKKEADSTGKLVMRIKERIQFFSYFAEISATYTRTCEAISTPSRVNYYLLLLLLLLTKRLTWRLVQKLQGHVTYQNKKAVLSQR